MSFGGSASLTKPQLLAIGLGNPDDLSLQELRTFCELVYPVESKCAYFVDRAKLKQEAAQYLQRATAADLLRNFETFPNKDLGAVEARLKECSVEVMNVDSTLKNLVRYLKARKKSEVVNAVIREASEIISI
jgi:hypothetical protein